MNLSKQKRICRILAPMLIVTSILSACGNGDETAPSPSAGGTAEMTTVKPADASALKPYELQLYFGGSSPRDTELVEKEINKYLQKKINATVKLNFVPFGDISTKIPVLLASGQKIDVLFTDNGYYSSLASKGALTPVNDLLSKYGPDAQKSMYSRFLELTKINGKNYAIQNPKEIASQYGWRINTDLAKKQGIDVSSVNSIMGLGSALKQMKEKDPTMNAIEPNSRVAWYVPFDYVLNDAVPFGMVYEPKATDGKIVDMWETPESKKALAQAREFYKAGYVRPDVATYKRPAGEDQAGKWLAGLMIGIPAADVIWSNNTGLKVSYAPIEKPVVNTSSIEGSMLSIPTTSQDPERAMMFINLLHGDVFLHNLFVYGIEGTHYTKVARSNNVIKLLPAFKEGWKPAWYMFGNGFQTYLTEDDPSDKWDQFQKFNDSSIVSPLVGFTFDPTPVQNEIAAITNISAEIKAPLTTGSVDPDEFLPKAIAKLKAAGSDKVIAEMQKQFDAYKATMK
ncbi:ABC transporter substrate-binding protein [Paenibacillus aceris]|uniref:Aldouronate transport system substrate-binding protein n=1 Tax=Paenibacillus aceris TaxID=869555 RepID=A0ABS4HZG1_9BACL|nr:ABC transporter substrate-binding protein [Paenibacillus aceris]MBP1963309.1 putative aldouronate transport system substrate-binding protein [Paenibacillus aceris]NHW36184.1 ABC transporter substrate-binding protein [Paenibacillus aceris]